MAVKAAGKKVPGKAVTAPSSKGVAPVSAEMLSIFADHAGSGLGNAQAQDFALPFLYLLQKMSPAIDEVDGAEPGMFMNTVSRELMSKLRVIPVEYEKVYNEWVPRDSGGGFVASHKTRETAEANRKDDESTQIVDTANHYVLVEQEDGSFTQAILSCTSTKLKASRQWLSRISQVMMDVPGRGKVQMPSFAKFYEVVSTGPHKNDKGTYFSIQINPIEGEDGWVQDADLVEQALNFQLSLQSGEKGADFSKSEVIVAEVEDDEDEEEVKSGKRKF